MSKVKSAIITAILLLAIITLTLFATISCDVPGSNGVNRYNSFMSMIPLGRDFTGEATIIIYPDGVISDEDYHLVVSDTEEPNAEKRAEYLEKYVQKGSLWIDKDKLAKEEGGEYVTDDKNTTPLTSASVRADAKILSDRFSQKGYSSYSVYVVDGYGIKISVPTSFTYAAYKGYDADANNDALQVVANSMHYLTSHEGFKLTDEDGNHLLSLKERDKLNAGKYILGASFVTASGIYGIKVDFTDDGADRFNQEILGRNSDSYLYVGETEIFVFNDNSVGIEGNSIIFFVNADADVADPESCARDIAILIDSVAHGSKLSNSYEESKLSASLATISPATGENAAIYLAILVLVVVLLAMVLPVFKYRLLGLVNAIMVLTYCSLMITFLMLIGVELTFAGVLTVVLGLALMCFSNFFTFEAIRRETALGRTVQSAVKIGYKRSLFGVLDVHVILVLASIVLTLVCMGEAAVCGLIGLIVTAASFVLYWFTRFMWYVISSPVSDKFKFAGFERRVEEDD